MGGQWFGGRHRGVIEIEAINFRCGLNLNNGGSGRVGEEDDIIDEGNKDDLS